MGRIPTGAMNYALKPLYDMLIAKPNLLNEYDSKTTSASTLTIDMTVYETRITSSGAGTTQNATVGDGTGATIGQRKLVRLVTRTHASDVVSLNDDDIVNASGTQLTNCDLDSAGDFLLLEWNGAKWQVIYMQATTTTA